MQRMLTAFYTKPLVIYLVLALIAISAAAGPADAMLVPASPAAPAGVSSGGRSTDLAVIQRSLESAELRQRLLDYGLTPQEIEARVNGLSDEQLHQLASNLDAVQAGGDGLGLLFSLVIIAALVVLIIFLLEGRIEVRKK